MVSSFAAVCVQAKRADGQQAVGAAQQLAAGAAQVRHVVGGVQHAADPRVEGVEVAGVGLLGGDEQHGAAALLQHTQERGALRPGQARVEDGQQARAAIQHRHAVGNVGYAPADMPGGSKGFAHTISSLQIGIDDQNISHGFSHLVRVRAVDWGASSCAFHH